MNMPRPRGRPVACSFPIRDGTWHGLPHGAPVSGSESCQLHIGADKGPRREGAGCADLMAMVDALSGMEGGPWREVLFHGARGEKESK